ncbi:hypothetical protein DSO57_1034943 [Entomophthora muscae]|uniref:Uncharacterized protein n=1 Tax=Entomophthora muscae TaxID=34485 RepID=A0ACC2UKF9_9FUNG|nr:hypothetical protein DSO57_1034943 [Entomophthora muscae]
MAMVCIKYSGPVRPVQAVWAGIGCTIGLGILGSVVSAAVAFVGDITIGLAAGWSIWAIVAGMIPSQIGNLAVGFLLSIAGGVAVRLQPLRFGEVAVCWLGSTLLTQGLMGVIINSMLISSSSTDAVQTVYLITYIIAILFTVCLFGLTLKLQSTSILCAEKEGFDNAHQS